MSETVNQFFELLSQVSLHFYAQHASHVHHRRDREQDIHPEGASDIQLPRWWNDSLTFGLQKITDSGRITKSAHPGASRVLFVDPNGPWETSDANVLVYSSILAR